MGAIAAVMTMAIVHTSSVVPKQTSADDSYVLRRGSTCGIGIMLDTFTSKAESDTDYLRQHLTEGGDLGA